MTEAEWLASNDPTRMLAWMDAPSSCAGRPWSEWKPSDRKLQLFACACCRQVWHLLADERSRRAVGVVERWADLSPDRQSRTRGVLDHQRAAMTAPDLYPSSLYTAVWLATHEPLMLGEFAHAIGAEGRGCLFATQAALLREIVGNPFRPVVREHNAASGYAGPMLFARHVTRQVIDLARAAYQERPGRECPPCYGSGEVIWMSDASSPPPERLCQRCHGTGKIDEGALNPARLAVLADALEEAGCPAETRATCPRCKGSGYGKAPRPVSNPPCLACGASGTVAVPHPLLAHLRSPGPHVRGCWALDLVLGKE